MSIKRNTYVFDTQSIIRKQILDVLGVVDRRDEKRWFGRIAYFQIPWDLFGRLETLYHPILASEALSTAIIIIGSATSAQATTIAGYLNQNWPDSAAQMLQGLRNGLQGVVNGSLSTASPEVRFHRHDQETFMLVGGSPRFIAEVGEQLAWIGSALFSTGEHSPKVNGLKYTSPFISAVSRGGTSRVQLSFAQSTCISSSPRGACWHGLFDKPVAVQGFPHSNQGQIGLDIPLHLMAERLGTSLATEFDGSLIIKGFSAVLFATKLLENGVMQWHLILNEDGSYLGYNDSRIEQLQASQTRKIGLSELNSPSVKKHAVGWCALAQSNTGTLHAPHPVAISACSTVPPRGVVVEKLTLTGGQYINIGLSAVLNPRHEILELASPNSTYKQNIYYLSRKPVLLYNDDERRGWLVNCASALLHIAIATWRFELASKILIPQEFASNIEKLKFDPVDQTARAAVTTLTDPDNMNLPVMPGNKDDEKFLFRHYVERAMDFMERAFAHQEKERAKPGKVINIERHVLPGFDFVSFSEVRTGGATRRFAKLKAGSKGWATFVHNIDAIALFGRGFGNLITPRTLLCRNWNTMPLHKDYIAVRVEDMNDFARYNPEALRKLVWYPPVHCFGRCHCPYNDGRTCGRAHALIHKSWGFSAVRKSFTDFTNEMAGKDNGAIILGNDRQVESNNSLVDWKRILEISAN
ncbi:hypothetical protein HDK77DRAFT_432068 [Phyllosticta capitalensis]